MEKSIGEIVEDELKYAERMHKIEEELGCPIEAVTHLVMDKPFYYEDENGTLHKIDIFQLCNKDLIFYMSWKDVDIYLGENGDIELPLSDYKKTWFLKEDKSE